MNPSPPPIAWTIAGSDSGGGAGIQADLKTLNAFGVHGCSVITAITAQNTLGVEAVEPVSPSLLSAQLKTMEADLPPAAIKTGMLGSAASCTVVADFLEPRSCRPLLICDPVLKSTSGTHLLEPGALDILVRRIFPCTAILTPNLEEAEVLTGQSGRSVEETALRILEQGVASVLIKGGHADSAECRDYWTDGKHSLWLSSPRIETTATHGSGCVLSAAITAAIALGQALPDAVFTAKTFLNQCLKGSTSIGAGNGPMSIRPFRDDPADRPVVTKNPYGGTTSPLSMDAEDGIPPAKES